MKAACALALTALLAADSALTPEQTLDRRAIGDLEFSPDGAQLVFTVAEPVKGTSRARALWLLGVASGRLRQLTFSGKSDASPRWAPDGSAIAFTSNRDGVDQLYLLPLVGGEAERLTDRKERVEAFRWSPDGKQIAILMQEPVADDRQRRERDKDDSRAVDKDDRHKRVWILDVATKALRQATSSAWRIEQIEWLPDGHALVAAATDHPEADRWIDRIYRIDVGERATDRFTEIAAPRGPFGSIALSPDGRTIAYIGARVDGPEPHDLYLQPVGGGAATNETATTIDRPVNQPHWRDNQTVTAHVQRGFKGALAAFGRDGRTQAIDDLDVNPTTFAESRDGTIAFVGDSTTRAPELYVKPARGRAKAITSVNSQWASIPLVAPEFVTYKSFDGVEIEGALLKPQVRLKADSASGASPFIVLVHGGPTGRWSDSFEPWGQLLAARGYAVLYPNVRGSTGYGQTFVEMNRGDWGGGDFKDVMAGVDAMIARGVADPNRLGIGGWSYGGYMAAWAVTQTNRFKAAVSGAPVIDMASEFGTENGSAYDEWFYGTPYEKLEGFIKSSPMTHVKNVRTPTLLLQGEDDLTDPLGQSQQFYRGLKRYGVDAELVVYPREPHGFREEKHLLDRMHRLLAWFDRYLKPQADSSAR
jgi:dipeptidyl aminopeptidase/acylaminoacyl peptidase